MEKLRPGMDEVNQTRQTYDRIAPDYAQAWQDRAVLEPTILRFVELVKPGGLVFDVGCGPGFDTAVFQQHNLRAFGLDYSLGMMYAGRRDLSLPLACAQADMRRLPLPTACADGLWVCASLLHISRADVPATLAEFGRVLKPGGILLTSVKQGEGERWVDSPYGRHTPRFFTFWQPDAFDAALHTAGLTIIDGWLNPSRSATAEAWLVRFSQKPSS